MAYFFTAIIFKKINQFIKAKELGLPKPTFSEEAIKLMSEKAKERIKNGYWNKERREQQCKSMQEAVKKYPNSYSGNNVCGRTKLINYFDSYGKQVKLNGSWELIVAQYLDESKIKWTNILPKGFEYIWEGNTHLYFPDFYLPEYNLYLEVKGYERERDRCKWESLNNLIIIKNKEIKLIKENQFKVL